MKYTLSIIIFLLVQSSVLAQSPIPVGSIVMWSASDNNGGSPPDNYLMCNGACVSQSTYADLYNLIGDTYGTGCSGSEFQLPNFNGSSPFGANGLNITHDFRLGKTGGSEFVTLTLNQIPAHDHGIRNFFADGVAGSNFDFAKFEQGTGTFYGFDYTNLSGSGNSHENTPPYLAVGFMIKALPDTDEAIPITTTYDIDIGFADLSGVSITRTLVTTDTEHYFGTINLPAFYKSFDTLYTIAMFMVFVLIGAAAGKPTMFIISFIGLYITGVLQNGGNYVTYPLLILAAAYLIYKFIIIRRQI